MLIDYLNFSQFCDGFPDSYKNNFSYEGKKALFEYLEQVSEDIGEHIEYDPIGFCCDYNESHYNDIAKDYGLEIEELDEEEAIKAVEDYLSDNTFIAAKLNEVFIYQVF